MTELLLAYSWTKLFKLPDNPTEWAWFFLGICGNAVFFTRFLVQWVHSEKHGESRIPISFWWQSIAGTMLLLAYFVHKRDIPGMLGYIANIIPYSRNLVLVYRKRRVDEAAAMEVVPVAGGTPAEHV